MKEIKKDNVVLARYITAKDIKSGLNFYSLDSEYIQVGIWGQYEQGKELPAHIHNCFERTSYRTYEVLYVISGQIEAIIYDLEENLIDILHVCQGEILILLECGHKYRILDDNTTVLEVKNGPYLGAEKDRYRF